MFPNCWRDFGSTPERQPAVVADTEFEGEDKVGELERQVVSEINDENTADWHNTQSKQSGELSTTTLDFVCTYLNGDTARQHLQFQYHPQIVSVPLQNAFCTRQWATLYANALTSFEV